METGHPKPKFQTKYPIVLVVTNPQHKSKSKTKGEVVSTGGIIMSVGTEINLEGGFYVNYNNVRVHH